MSKNDKQLCLGVLTSGGDSPGMNAAVRAVVRTGLHLGAEVFAIREGYKGLVEGGEAFRKMEWSDVGGILNEGGTVLGTARCLEFKKPEVQRQAAKNLLEHGINRLVIIGGDGSLTGAGVFHKNWPELLKGVPATEEKYAKMLKEPPGLHIAGIIGSIDNDMYGSDLTIGADTALHRIRYAVDAINSTAASHQRSFVVEVMGNRCGYLAMMTAVTTGADWVLIPEDPPRDERDKNGKLVKWEDAMCAQLRAGREANRRATIVIMAEGAKDAKGERISSEYIKQVLEEKLQEDVRVTILGHVQRGGSPSAFDRNMSTILGHAAAERVLTDPPEVPVVAGLRGNHVCWTPLVDALEATNEVGEALKAKDFELALRQRGGEFNEIYNIAQILMKPKPRRKVKGVKRPVLAVLHCGAQAPGMNTAVRTAVRLGMDKGHTILGIKHGFEGLIEGNPVGRKEKNIEELSWMKVNGWAVKGGAELGTNRDIPGTRENFTKIAERLEQFEIQGLLIVGGWAGYQAAYTLYQKQNEFPEFRIPIVCIPATVSNRLPGTELCVGADTTLNNIVEALDKIKQSAVGLRRCFFTEVAGYYCGYLALMSGLATGGDRLYLHEDGFTFRQLKEDLEELIEEFKKKRRLALLIRNEMAHPAYDMHFMTTLFGEEGGDSFEVRHSILGHLQHGGIPSVMDRILATRFADSSIDFLSRHAGTANPFSGFVGIEKGEITINNLNTFPAMVDKDLERPRKQWWLKYRNIADMMAMKPEKSAE